MIQSTAEDDNIRLRVAFFQTENGREPVREWLKTLSIEEKRIIGTDIKTVQFGWPLGMPVVRKLEQGLWEIRSTLPNGISRIFFTLQSGIIILLHGFIKKSNKTPLNELILARQRLVRIRSKRGKK
jgi:phage-related protein